MKPKANTTYGLMAEFESEDDILKAAVQIRDAGYRETDAFSPFPIHGLDSAIGAPRTKLSLIVFMGGLMGCIGGFGMQYFASVIHYPMNIGGRPLNSWPSFIPITFECSILLAVFSAVFGMLILNKLPMPYHPVFNVDAFSRASQDRFFLIVESKDPKYDENDVRKIFESCNADAIHTVDP
jgi:hypothetical protein